MSFHERLWQEILERPDRTASGPSDDAVERASQDQGAAAEPVKDWESSMLSALDSFASEDEVEAAPARPAVEPAVPVDTPVILQWPPPEEDSSSPAVTERELFASEPESGPASRVAPLVSAVAAAARSGIGSLMGVALDLKRSKLPSRLAPPCATSRSRRLAVLAFVLATVVVAVGWLVMTSAVASGSLTVTSRPPRAEILVDGEARGVTPATLRVPAGDHVLEIRSAGPAQVVSLRIDKGEQVSRFFELPVGTAAASVHVTTTPAGVAVMVDGRPRGKTPVVVSDLNPGPHHVRIKRGSQSLERFIMLESGANGALALPLAPSGGAPPEGHGWLDVSVPVDVRAFENGRLVGTTRAGPWQLTAGRHDLEFVNQAIGVYVKTAVDVLAGKTVTLEVPVSPGFLSVDASPSAEVQVDGESLGAAPIVKRALVAGQHDIVARHPVMGERRITVTVPTGAAVSVTIDFRR